MVGKKSGKALLREEGLERTDNNMEMTSWPVIQAINQKNYYTDYLKRDEQILAFRSQREEDRNKMIKQARDRDRALAQGHIVEPEGDVDMEDGDEEAEDEASSGAKTIVIHLGSQNLRVGLANDALPKTVPMVIARRAQRSESEENDGEPAPKRAKLSNGLPPPEPEKRFGEDFAKKFSGMSQDLKVRMRMNKRKVLPQSRDMVTSYNRRNTYDTITEHNDTMRIEWTDTSNSPEYITGKAALRIPDKSTPRYKLYWPIRYGWLNEQDYESKRFLYDDIRIILEEAIRTQLELNLKTREEWAQYSVVIVTPDYYERTYVTGLLDMAITEFGFGRVCFFQESLACSFGAGFTTCCVVDIGAQKTAISCVEDGMILDNSRVNLKYGGRDITEMFVKMIIYNHFPYSELNLNRRYDFQLAEELKAKYCTMTEADISVQLYDFHLRAPNQDTRKYTFKIYDEVILAPMGLFRPQVLEDNGKLNGRHKLLDRSYDIYDGKSNDPTSTAQAEILTSIAPPEVLNSTNKSFGLPTNGHTNGLLPNGSATKDESFNDSRRPSFSNIKEIDATPQPSAASSPVRQSNLDGTPAPDDVIMDGAEGVPNGYIGQQNLPPPLPRPEEEEPLPLERRDDILPVYPLPAAIVTSITHAARGSSQKTSDLLSGIMLTGGTSVIPGLASHLEDALKGILPGYSKDILIGRPPRELDPQVVAWKGGAVFGRMSRTNDSWINAFLYERLGERVLAHKLMWAW
ncbi:actin-like protein arp8 [Cladophialophora chaetospira]|uniref:Actin-like protein arp8 n=1 Tax=Cladophialophora chaetospira TaxID=386627 RepID=A0AA39CIA7_9EURO|nr:actin-like protein arp8 [Cladophialophora chaetospira]